MQGVGNRYHCMSHNLQITDVIGAVCRGTATYTKIYAVARDSAQREFIVSTTLHNLTRKHYDYVRSRARRALVDPYIFEWQRETDLHADLLTIDRLTDEACASFNFPFVRTRRTEEPGDNSFLEAAANESESSQD
jgi:hypothetical protein